MRVTPIIVVGIALGMSAVADADPAASVEFFIMTKACKGVASSSNNISRGMKVFDDSTRDWACSHAGPRKLSCVQQMDDGPSTEELLVDLDTSDTLILRNESSAYWFWIDRKTRVASYTVRLVIGPSKDGGMVIGSSVCQGMYLTADEARALKKK
jgi:hypothetical protein